MNNLARISLALVLSFFSIRAAADTTVESIGEAFIENLPSGWNATVGSWVYFDSVGCFVTPGYLCYANNPASPYGSPYFGEYGTKPNLATLQLDEDEAVVLIFRTPPEMRYYSFVQYLFQKAGDESHLFASMSTALNMKQLGTAGSPEPGASPFDSYAAVIWAADQNTFDSAQQSLLESGLPLQAINFLPIPQRIPATTPGGSGYDLQMGHGAGHDIFNLIMRTALPGNQAEYVAYRRENPYYVVRVGPTTHLQPRPAPVIGYPSDISGVEEDASLEVALDHLVSDIERNYDRGFSLQEDVTTYTTHNGWECITGSATCGADNFDALYSSKEPKAVKVASLKDFVLIVGVNHRQAGKAAYVNYSAYDFKKLASVVSVADPDLTGQSALYHAGITDSRDPRVDEYQDLFAYMISYNCAGRQYCVTIPSPTRTNPVGLRPGAPFFILGRSYMEPHTLVRPAETEVIRQRMFVGTKRK